MEKLKSFLYVLGRAFQVCALLVLPSAIWVGRLGHSEKGSIAIFLSCILIFVAGYFLTRLRRSL